MSIDDPGPGVPPGPIGNPKPRPSGFRILLYVLAALGAVGVLTCGGLTWYAFQQPGVREMFQSLAQSANAPGAAELRAAGCEQAGVMDMAGALDEFLEDRHPEAEGLEMPTLFVACQHSAADGPDCDEVARIYRSAVGPLEDRFVARVNGTGLTPQTVCQFVYAPDGTRLGTLEEVTRPSEPTPAP